MKKFISIAALVLVAAFSTGCTRISDGEVGVRVGFGGEINQTELGTGYHQVLVGDVLEFPVRDLSVTVGNLKPMTTESSPLADFDINVVYNVNPAAVADIYKNKARSFHTKDQNTNEIHLMNNYVQVLINNAVNESVRKFKQLEVVDHRQVIEDNVKILITNQLKEQKLDNALTISAVQIKNILPNSQVLLSATDLVRSQNELKIKDNEVQIAKKEAERMQALAVNSAQSIAYMQAQANLTIAQAVKEGKVQTILIPHTMTALGTIK